MPGEREEEGETKSTPRKTKKQKEKNIGSVDCMSKSSGRKWESSRNWCCDKKSRPRGRATAAMHGRRSPASPPAREFYFPLRVCVRTRLLSLSSSSPLRLYSTTLFLRTPSVCPSRETCRPLGDVDRGARDTVCFTPAVKRRTGRRSSTVRLA